SSPVAGHGQEEDVVDDLARTVGNPKPPFDEDLRDAVDDDDPGGDHRQEAVATGPAQCAVTFSTLTWSSSPSAFKASEQAPSGGEPRSTCTASVSAAI